jgi:hypothetical protein
MECWGVRERVCVCVCAVEVFIGTASITDTLRGFRSKRNQQEAPSLNPIRRWVRQWREKKVSVKCKKPPSWPSSVHTPDKCQKKRFKRSCAAS